MPEEFEKSVESYGDRDVVVLVFMANVHLGFGSSVGSIPSIAASKWKSVGRNRRKLIEMGCVLCDALPQM